jgi:hypothetical protein
MDLKDLKLSQIALLIHTNWPTVYFGAKPYLQAMFTLDSIDQNFYQDSGRSVVAYFLSNASQWRGEVARSVKKELNRRLKGAK